MNRLTPVEALEEALEFWVAERPDKPQPVTTHRAKRFAELLAVRGYRLRPIYERNKEIR